MTPTALIFMSQTVHIHIYQKEKIGGYRTSALANILNCHNKWPKINKCNFKAELWADGRVGGVFSRWEELQHFVELFLYTHAILLCIWGLLSGECVYFAVRTFIFICKNRENIAKTEKTKENQRREWRGTEQFSIYFLVEREKLV